MSIVLPLAASLSLAVAVPPGVYFEQTTVVYADGKPSGPGVVSRVWCAGKRMRLEAGDAGTAGPAFILRLDEGKAYRVDPLEKRVAPIDLDELRARSQEDLSMAGDLMGADAEGSARSRPLRGKPTIAGYPCDGYRLTTGSMVMDVYVTRSLGIGVDAFADFLQWSGASQALGGLMAEIRKLPGFPLETRSRVTVLGEVHETRSTVTKVVVGPQPAQLFEPPRGYAVVPDGGEMEE
jgi:hypothetical protein